MPVYSLATYDGQGSVNMNICTYVSAVSMNPKRYMVAVYRNTKTLANLATSNRCVLQLLGKQSISLINVLGKKSGFDTAKQNYLNRRKLLSQWNGYSILTDSVALLELTTLWSNDGGDHVVFVFDVKSFRSRQEQILMLDHLRAKRLVRI